MRNKKEIEREINIIKTEAKIKVKKLEIELLELELAELRGETKDDEIKVSKSKVNTSKVNKTKTNKTTKTSVKDVKPNKDNGNAKFVKGMQSLLEEDEDEDFDIDEFLNSYQEPLDVKSLFSEEDEEDDKVAENDRVKEPKREVVDKTAIKALVNKMAKEFNLKNKKKFKAIANEMLDLCNDGVKLNEIEEAIREHVNVVSEDCLIAELKLMKKITIKQYVDKAKILDDDIPVEQIEVVKDVTDDILGQLLDATTNDDDDLFKDFK